jgi:hypothetical protein
MNPMTLFLHPITVCLFISFVAWVVHVCMFLITLGLRVLAEDGGAVLSVGRLVVSGCCFVGLLHSWLRWMQPTVVASPTSAVGSSATKLPSGQKQNWTLSEIAELQALRAEYGHRSFKPVHAAWCANKKLRLRSYLSVRSKMERMDEEEEAEAALAAAAGASVAASAAATAVVSKNDGNLDSESGRLIDAASLLFC